MPQNAFIFSLFSLEKDVNYHRNDSNCGYDRYCDKYYDRKVETSWKFVVITIVKTLQPTLQFDND
jgi:hypothetical protein